MSYTYSLVAGSTAVLRSDGAFIPDDSNNQDWMAYQAWISAGHTPVAVPSPTVAQLAAQLVSAATSVAAAIVGQVFVTPASQAALQNAALIILVNGGTAPSTGPNASALASMATAYGASSVSAFATMVTTSVTQSITLETALVNLQAAAQVASTSSALASALSTFETAVAGVISALNAVLVLPIVAPAAIVIPGINA